MKMRKKRKRERERKEIEDRLRKVEERPPLKICERPLELDETLFGRHVSRIAELARTAALSLCGLARNPARKFTFIRPPEAWRRIFLQAFRGGRGVVA